MILPAREGAAKRSMMQTARTKRRHIRVILGVANCITISALKFNNCVRNTTANQNQGARKQADARQDAKICNLQSHTRQERSEFHQLLRNAVTLPSVTHLILVTTPSRPSGWLGRL